MHPTFAFLWRKAAIGVVLVGWMGLLGLTGCRAPSAAWPTLLPTPTRAPVTRQPTRPMRPSPSPTAAPSAEPTSPGPRPSPSPSPTATPSPVPATHERPFAQQHTLRARYDPVLQRVFVTQTIQYTNNTGQTLTSLPLVVPPLAYSTLILEELTVQGQAAVPEVDIPTLTWHIPLPQPVAPGEAITLALQYQLVLKPLRTRAEETARPMVFGYTASQTNLVDWYPFVPVYDAERGWVVRAMWPFGEYLTYPWMAVQLELTYPPSWLLAANVEPTPCPEAAAGRLCGTHVGRGVAISLSPYYRVVQGSVRLAPHAASVQVRVYAFGGMDTAAARVLTYSQQALSDFSRWFGPYHRPWLHVVVADFPFSMEYDGLVFVRKGYWDAMTAGLDALTVHEIAHQWWFAQVANDQARHPWMDESLATFSEWLFLRHRLPERLEWWETGRWNGLAARGYIDGAIYDYGSMLTYREAVYHHGALFWREAYHALGEEALFRVLRDYARAHQQGVAWPRDLLQPLQQAWPDAPWAAYFRTPPAP